MTISERCALPAVAAPQNPSELAIIQHSKQASDLDSVRIPISVYSCLNGGSLQRIPGIACRICRPWQKPGIDEATQANSNIDPATEYCAGAPSIPAFFAGMGGRQCHSFLAGSILRPASVTSGVSCAIEHCRLSIWPHPLYTECAKDGADVRCAYWSSRSAPSCSSGGCEAGCTVR